MCNYETELNKWKNSKKLNRDLLLEIDLLENEKEKEDRFYKKLEFGTAGMRGLLGAGTNRMNVHTVAEVTQALADKLNKDSDAEKGVVIGYDTRHMSKEFAELSASILIKNGINVHLFKDVAATPLLSYAVIRLKKASGIMITASHNPKEYNGYKLYGSDGIQINKEYAGEIVENISSIGDIFDVETKVDLKDVNYVSEKLVDSYIQKASMTLSAPINKDLSIVYTPLNGVGKEFVQRVLSMKGYKNVHTVKEQEMPDPNFTTTPSPNPENEEVFKLAIREGIKHNAEVLIATDPDADRIGLMIKDNGSYSFVSGNIVGTVLSFYLMEKLYFEKRLPKNPKIVKTIATDNLIDKIAGRYGVEVVNVHVGFKNIYSKVSEWETLGDSGYILGYEESLGYGLGSSLARDKDAVSAMVVILEMVSYYHSLGENILTIYRRLQENFEFHTERLESITLPGKDGLEKMNSLMVNIRNNPIEELNGSELSEVIDYLEDGTGLEKQNVIKYVYNDGSWFVIRPSGTEPKLKIYSYTVSPSKTKSEEKADSTMKILREWLS